MEGEDAPAEAGKKVRAEGDNQPEGELERAWLVAHNAVDVK